MCTLPILVWLSLDHLDLDLNKIYYHINKRTVFYEDQKFDF